MNKKEINYVSPTVAVKEITFEGVLCMSLNSIRNSDYGFQEWTEKDFTWQ